LHLLQASLGDWHFRRLLHNQNLLHGVKTSDMQLIHVKTCHMGLIRSQNQSHGVNSNSLSDGVNTRSKHSQNVGLGEFGGMLPRKFIKSSSASGLGYDVCSRLYRGT